MLLSVFAPVLGLLIAATTTGPGETAAVADRAEALIAQIQANAVDRTSLTPAFRTIFTSNVIATDAAFLAGRGKPSGIGLVQRTDVAADVRYVFQVSLDAGPVTMTIGIDKKTDLIDACYFRPAGSATSPPPAQP